MADFFQQNRQIVYFVYGGAFFVLGLAITLQSRKHSQIGWARHLWLLAAFGFIHGAFEWGSVFIPIQQNYLSSDVITAFRLLQLGLEAVSFLALFQFGVELIRLVTKRDRLRIAPLLLLLVWATTVAGLSVLTVESFGEFVNVGDAMSRYLLGIPGAAATAWGLWQQADEAGPVSLPRIARYLRSAACAFGLYAVLSAIVPRGDFFPASILNYDNMVAVVGIPAAIFRTLLGILIAVLIIRALEIFDLETDRLIEEAAQAHMLSAERERIGRELHDSIIQSLHAAGLVLEDAATMMDQDPAYAKARIGVVNRSLGLTIRDIRAFILDLQRDDDSGAWREGLGELVREFRLQTLINAEFRVIGTAQCEPLDKKGQEILSIAREALSNVAKHSQATQVRVTLTVGERTELEIADNGIGMGEGEPMQYAAGEHLGLANMRTRAELIGGTLTIESAPQRGTTVRLILLNGEPDKGKRYDAQDYARR